MPSEENKAGNDLADLTIRKPRPEDVYAVYDLACDAGNLTPDSVYFYGILCSILKETCRVAEHKGRVVGWVLGILCDTEDGPKLFIRQACVDAVYRGSGIDGFYVTIEPGNKASQQLAKSVARAFGADISKEPWLPEAVYGDRLSPEEIWHVRDKAAEG